MTTQLYFRQLLSGQDFATNDPVAKQMANFVYLIGDYDRHEAVVVDGAYAPGEIVDICDDDGMNLTGAVVTHYHADHAGGLLGSSLRILGVRDLLDVIDIPIHIHADERAWLSERTGIDDEALISHSSGDVIMIGDLPLTVIHTPGHTEGSQCLLINGQLLTGDTLFLDGCGRTDLPGGDAAALFESLHLRLSSIGNDVPIFPGHAYSPLPSATMGELRAHNRVLSPCTREQWLARFGE